MRAAYQREIDALEAHLAFLASVGSVSPYIGLFGTVWGIMNAFRGLGNVQQATLANVAPGIAEALIATAIGLFAAIPAVVAYNRYHARHRPPGNPLRDVHRGVLQHPAAAGALSGAMLQRCAAAARASSTEINVVPYIDVMLVLLVIFMVTAPLVKPERDQPADRGKSALPPDDYIQIALKPDEAATIGISGGSARDQAADRVQPGRTGAPPARTACAER